MTVRELLAELQHLPRDLEVLAFEAGCEEYCEREVDDYLASSRRSPGRRSRGAGGASGRVVDALILRRPPRTWRRRCGYSGCGRPTRVGCAGAPQIRFEPHQFRHTYCDLAATQRRRDGNGEGAARPQEPRHHRGHYLAQTRLVSPAEADRQPRARDRPAAAAGPVMGEIPARATSRSCAIQASRRAVWSRSGPRTPLSSTGPISTKDTGAASAASTTSWLTSTSPGLAYSAILAARFTVRPK
jgi:hypothetical protein